MMVPVLSGDQFQEFLNSQAGLPDNGPEGSGIQLAMIRHNHLGKWAIPPEDEMASVLSPEFEAGLRQCRHAIPPREVG
jgi:hypothetical protein